MLARVQVLRCAPARCAGASGDLDRTARGALSEAWATADGCSAGGSCSGGGDSKGGAVHAEIARYHALGNLPEPERLTHKFF